MLGSSQCYNLIVLFFLVVAHLPVMLWMNLICMKLVRRVSETGKCGQTCAVYSVAYLLYVSVLVIVMMSSLLTLKKVKPIIDAIFTGLFDKDRGNSWVFELRIKADSKITSLW